MAKNTCLFGVLLLSQISVLLAQLTPQLAPQPFLAQQQFISAAAPQQYVIGSNPSLQPFPGVSSVPPRGGSSNAFISDYTRPAVDYACPYGGPSPDSTLLVAGDDANTLPFQAFSNPTVLLAGDRIATSFGYGSTPNFVAAGNQRTSVFGDYSRPSLLSAGDDSFGYYGYGSTPELHFAGDNFSGYMAPGAQPSFYIKAGVGNAIDFAKTRPLPPAPACGANTVGYNPLSYDTILTPSSNGLALAQANANSPYYSNSLVNSGLYNNGQVVLANSGLYNNGLVALANSGLYNNGQVSNLAPYYAGQTNNAFLNNYPPITGY